MTPVLWMLLGGASVIFAAGIVILAFEMCTAPIYDDNYPW